MIIFQKLRWKNFLSTGNSFTEIDLSRSKTTLIVGENGAGKSTILDALSYGLYGKPFRKINKPQLMNSINGKNLVVELNFNIGLHSYKIIRGMKPNVFEIYQNDKLLNQNSESRDYQEIFEKQFLKLNHKSFSQIVVLGSASFTPFMQLPAAHRREVIEDLLDIQIFSTMNVLLKGKMQQNKDDTSKTSMQIRLTEQKIELHKQNIEKLKQNNDELIAEYKTKIEAAQKDYYKWIDLQSQAQNQNTSLKEKIIDQDKITGKLKKLDNLEYQIYDKHKKIEKEIGFYHDNDNCPTCKQELHVEFKQDKITNRHAQQLELKAALIKLKEEKNKCHDRVQEINAIQVEIDANNHGMNEYIHQIRLIENIMQSYTDSINSIESQTSKIDIDGNQLEVLSAELIDNINKKNQLIEQKLLHDIAANLLKDTGIKTKIIKQYIPVMNKLINKYLATMDFFVNFELNENFEEKIKSRFRDEFSYQSFSEGEKLRIDLALLFTWRAISKLRNSTSTNLLIMDEIFDSSLDNSGTEEFLKMLQSLTSDTNVFIISHKGDALYDKFHSMIKFEKHKNFSRIAV
jgi:DNA repair exonuclease SbcCD ATPase subunit